MPFRKTPFDKLDKEEPGLGKPVLERFLDAVMGDVKAGVSAFKDLIPSLEEMQELGRQAAAGDPNMGRFMGLAALLGPGAVRGIGKGGLRVVKGGKTKVEGTFEGAASAQLRKKELKVVDPTKSSNVLIIEKAMKHLSASQSVRALSKPARKILIRTQDNVTATQGVSGIKLTMRKKDGSLEIRNFLTLEDLERFVISNEDMLVSLIKK